MTDYGPLLTAAHLAHRNPTPRAARPDNDAGGGADGGSTTGWAVLLGVAELAQQAAGIASWWVLGAAVLTHTGLTAPRALAWVGLLAAGVAARTVAVWAAGHTGVTIGTGVRRSLIATILHLDPDSIRHRGVGQLLGIVLEANTLETATVNGALSFITGVGFAVAGAVVIATAHTASLAAPTAVWVAATVAFTAVYIGRRRTWQHQRGDHTNELTERLLGHRTVQLHDNATTRTHADTAALATYDKVSRRADTLSTLLTPGMARLWTLAAIGIVVATDTGQTVGQAAAAFGAILLIARAADQIGIGIIDLTDARLAHTAVRTITDHPHPPTGASTPPGNPTAPAAVTPVTATGVMFTYDAAQPPVLDHVDLTIADGDRVLLTGRSGSGKTTLAMLLAGHRTPTSGTIHAPTTALVPQYDDNHILLGSLAYNLLLGTHWPPDPDHLDAAEHLCIELGLGPLLDLMPSGIFENVGETGWQLSHGERSRIYLARALLQHPQLAIIDETFGTLDPATHRHALTTATAHTPTTLLIAHP